MVQDTPDHLMVRIVRCDNYTQADEIKLQNKLREYLGEQIRIDLDYVKEIPREANGKFRQIVSHVFRDRYGQSNNEVCRG